MAPLAATLTMASASLQMLLLVTAPLESLCWSAAGHSSWMVRQTGAGFRMTRPQKVVAGQTGAGLSMLRLEMATLLDVSTFDRKASSFKGLNVELEDLYAEFDLDEMDEEDEYVEVEVDEQGEQILSLAEEEDESEGFDEVEEDEEDAAEAILRASAGERVRGRVLAVEEEGALIDIDGKASGILPAKEAGLESMQDLRALVEVGQWLEVEIINSENIDGQPVLSLRRIQIRDAWDRVMQRQINDETVDAKILSINRGGCLCTVDGLKAFLPGSHCIGGNPSIEMVGSTIPVKFLEVNTEQAKLVVSNRRAVIESATADMSRGDVVEGVVSGVRPYGVFVELRGGMSGLLHISQVSYERVESLDALFSEGMRVKVMVIDHDKVNGRVALSTKTLEAEPGDLIKNPARVFEMAEATAKKYHEKMMQERRAREEAAKNIVLGLREDGDEGVDMDPLASVTESIESILSNIANSQAAQQA